MPAGDARVVKLVGNYGEVYDRSLMCLSGGAKGSRTPDLLNAIQALSQLSYGPSREQESVFSNQKSGNPAAP
jgi:hypothetical protein